MSASAFTASLLRASADGFSGLAAGRLFEERGEAELGEGFGVWRARLRTQLLELAIALEDDAPERFAAHLAWVRNGMAARGHGTDGLGAGLERLSDVLQSSLPEETWQPLPAYFEAAQVALAQEATEPAGELGEGGLREQLALDFIQHLRSGDERAATSAILEAVENGRIEIGDLLETVLVPALREIGRLWYANAATVAEEHLVTTTTTRLLARILALAPVAPSNGRSIMLTSVAGDRHGIGVQFAAAFFELDGWRTVFLGSDMPATDLADAAGRFGVDLVALGATLETQREAVADAIRALRLSRPELKILVGGPAFAGEPPTWRRVGADAYAPSARDAVQVGRELVGL